MNADGGSVSDWNVENFCCLPARRWSECSTRSVTGLTKPVGELGPLDLVLHDARGAARPRTCCSGARRRAPRCSRGSPARAWPRAACAARRQGGVRLRRPLPSAPDGSDTRPRRPGRLFSDRYYPCYEAVRRGGVGRARVRAARGAAGRRRAPRGAARGVPRRAVGVPGQAPAGARAGRGARDREGPARRLPARAARRPRSPCSTWSRRSTATSPRSAAPRSAGAGRRAVPAREYRTAVRHPPGVHPRRRSVAGRARGDDDRRPRGGSGATRRRGSPSKRRARWLDEASLTDVQPAERSADVTPVRSLAAGAGPLAVVGLVAAGLELALLGLLAHKGGTLAHR